MATNQIMTEEGVYQRNVVVTYPATPTSGMPVRWGELTGVALTDEGEGGNIATETTVDFGPGMWDLSCEAVDGGGASAIAAGEALYMRDSVEPRITKINTDRFYGYAAEALGAGSTGTIHVVHIPAANTALALTGTLTGANVANVADANTGGGIPVLHRVDIADAATGDVDVVLTHKTRVVDAWFVKTAANAAAANTIQVKNGANAITDAMDANINDTLMVRAGAINDANHEIAAAGTLRITRTKAGGNAAGICYVLGLRVA